MAGSTATPAPVVLQSLWGNLSNHLIASFYEVDRTGQRTNPDLTVMAPLSEADFEVTLGWQSPFEQAGPETKAPTLFAMLQSGALQPVIDALSSGKSSANSVQQQTANFVKQFEGKTGITKLNSVQVFSGMPPVKIPVTAVFRAWKDAVSEVENPIDQLMSWALPVNLSADSTLLSNLINTAKNGGGLTDWINALLPSQSPTMIGMTYKGRTYSPLVIESIDYPISSPINADGNFVEMSVRMTLATLTALDRGDWNTIKSGGTFPPVTLKIIK